MHVAKGFVISSAMFRVTEYEGPRVNGPEAIHPVYQSRPMCLRDASRFAAALSHARGAYVQVIPDTKDETYGEWWYAGSLWSKEMVPPTCGDFTSCATASVSQSSSN
jgi:hypothetical protein